MIADRKKSEKIGRNPEVVSEFLGFRHFWKWTILEVYREFGLVLGQSTWEVRNPEVFVLSATVFRLV